MQINQYEIFRIFGYIRNQDKALLSGIWLKTFTSYFPKMLIKTPQEFDNIHEKKKGCIKVFCAALIIRFSGAGVLKE